MSKLESTQLGFPSLLHEMLIGVDWCVLDVPLSRWHAHMLSKLVLALAENLAQSFGRVTPVVIHKGLSISCLDFSIAEKLSFQSECSFGPLKAARCLLAQLQKSQSTTFTVLLGQANHLRQARIQGDRKQIPSLNDRTAKTLQTSLICYIKENHNHQILTTTSTPQVI